MLDYYSILEINESASKETVEKVHKLLVKKYHPDLQPKEKKKEAEEYMKLINEAYSVLTDPLKKQKYDKKLKEYRMQEIIKEMKKDGKIKQQTEESEIIKKRASYMVSEEDILKQAQAYYNELYNQYYKKGYIKDAKQEFKEMIAKIITVVIMLFLLLVIIKIPYTRRVIGNLIASNELLNSILGRFFD